MARHDKLLLPKVEDHVDSGDGLLLGLCCRWRPDETTTGMESSAAIGAEIILNGGFIELRLRTFDPMRILVFSEANCRVRPRTPRYSQCKLPSFKDSSKPEPRRPT